MFVDKRKDETLEKTNAAVSMRNITKIFGTIVANDDVSLDIYKGEILSLLGENGSGKTTLMNMLSGIYFPDGGQIFIDGKPVTIASPREARLPGSPNVSPSTIVQSHWRASSHSSAGRSPRFRM